MGKQIALTFRENEKEMYDFIKSQKSKSGYIKTLIEKDMAEQEGYKLYQREKIVSGEDFTPSWKKEEKSSFLKKLLG